MLDLCAVGDLHWLMVLPVPHLPRSGEMLQVSKVQRLSGNDATIVSLQAAQLGRTSCLFATNAIALRDGQPLIAKLQRAGVDTSFIETGAPCTPATFFLEHLSLDERVGLAEAYPFHCAPAPDRLPRCRFAYIDLYDEYLIERLALLRQWSQSGARLLVNLSASHLAEKMAQLASLPLEIIQLRGRGSVEEACAWGQQLLAGCQAQALLITLGAAGAVLLERHHTAVIAAEPVQPVRTIGAGASFSAGFLSTLLAGSTYREAALFASKHAAAFCASKRNPLEVMEQ